MNAPSESRIRAPRLREEAKSLYRNAILHAAEEVFAERGFFSARIQDIAERGGFAVGTVYKHFEQKEDVLRALLVERTAAMELALRERDEDPPGFEDKLVTRLARLFSYIEEHRAFYRIALENGLFGVVSASAGSPLGEKDRAKISGFKATMLELINEGIDEGILADVEPGLLASLLFGSVRAFTLGAFELDDAPEEKAAMIVGLFLRGAQNKTSNNKSSQHKVSDRKVAGSKLAGKVGGRERQARK
ncbi:MAG: TetR/AcrR family transcriptional regulator [Polyangiaceae bacterium]